MLCSRGHRYTSTSKHSRCPICEPARNRERMLEPAPPRLRHEALAEAEGARAYPVREHVRLRERPHVEAGSRFITSCRHAYDTDLFFELSNLELVCRVHHGMREREAKSSFTAITEEIEREARSESESFIVAILGSPAFRPWRHDGCHLVRAHQVRP